MNFKRPTKPQVLYSILSFITLAYVVLKANSMGNDINVYLHASKQFFNSENIYSNNPFNFYLYSPFFALLLRPLSIFDYNIGRIIWALINVAVTVRLWKIFYDILFDKITLSKSMRKWWTVIVIILSAGFLNHNLILGQITIIILWLTLEGLYQINKGNEIVGSVLIALGINIKIIPMLLLFYLFFKWKIKPLIYIGLVSVVLLFIPALFVGFQYNNDLLIKWKDTINPTKSKYVFEKEDGCNSLNAIIPAYFHDFELGEGGDGKASKRVLKHISYQKLLVILQFTRVIVLLSFLALVFYQRKSRESHSLYFFWEFSYLCIISLLIFPHQLKYVLLYLVPAGAYLTMFILLIKQLKLQVKPLYKVIAFFSVGIILLLSLSGRDIIGNKAVDFIDYYHIIGFIQLIFMAFLLIIRPDYLLKLHKKTLA